MAKTRLYLDVDGVLNAWMADREWGLQDRGEATSKTGTYEIVWAPALIKALDALDVELVWATTWEEEATTAISPLLGWHRGTTARWLSPPENFYYTMSNFRRGSISWKNPAVRDDQEESPSPFIWIDDEIQMSDIHGAKELGGLAMATDPYVGITPQQIQIMSEYIKTYR